jgi:hypothetical protein
MQVRKRWTEKCSLEAVKIFANLNVLTLNGCVEPWPFWPLLQRTMPLKALHMQRSKIQCDSTMCYRLFTCTAFRRLELDKGFVSECHWYWLESIPPAQLSSVLTHLSVEGLCDILSNWFNVWLGVTVRFPALQSLSLREQVNQLPEDL